MGSQNAAFRTRISRLSSYAIVMDLANTLGSFFRHSVSLPERGICRKTQMWLLTNRTIGSRYTTSRLVTTDVPQSLQKISIVTTSRLRRSKGQWNTVPSSDFMRRSPTNCKQHQAKRVRSGWSLWIWNTTNTERRSGDLL